MPTPEQSHADFVADMVADLVAGLVGLLPIADDLVGDVAVAQEPAAPGQVQVTYLQKIKKIRLVYRMPFCLPFHCHFCGSVKHKKDSNEKNGKIVCPVALLPAVIDLPRPCAYVMCSDRTSHTTAACQALHERCFACGCRGHNKAQCKDYSPEQFLSLFEYFGNMGRYTAKRSARREWGFYLVTHDEYYDREIAIRTPFPYRYDDLVRLPHDDAVRIVRDYNQLVRFKLGVVDPVRPLGLGPVCRKYFEDPPLF